MLVRANIMSATVCRMCKEFLGEKGFENLIYKSHRLNLTVSLLWFRLTVVQQLFFLFFLITIFIWSDMESKRSGSSCANSQ